MVSWLQVLLPFATNAPPWTKENENVSSDRFPLKPTREIIHILKQSLSCPSDPNKKVTPFGTLTITVTRPKVPTGGGGLWADNHLFDLSESLVQINSLTCQP